MKTLTKDELRDISTLHLLHQAWTRAVGTPGYDKREWTELSTRIGLSVSGESQWPDPDHLSAEEEKKWRKMKTERPTIEDWSDLHRAVVGYCRRFIERHESSNSKRA